MLKILFFLFFFLDYRTSSINKPCKDNYFISSLPKIQANSLNSLNKMDFQNNYCINFSKYLADELTIEN